MSFHIEYHIEESTLTIKFASYEAMIRLNSGSTNDRFLKELKFILDNLSSFEFIRKEDLPKEFSDESPYGQPLDMFELRYDALFDRDRLNIQCKLNVFFDLGTISLIYQDLEDLMILGKTFRFISKTFRDSHLLMIGH